MPEWNQPYATFRVTFNEHVTPASLSDFLESRARAADGLKWYGFACVENPPDGSQHVHGIVTNKTAAVVRDALRRFIQRSGAGGNEVYSVSAARDNTAAVQYSCKDVLPEPDDPSEDSVVSILWLSNFTVFDLIGYCQRYHERAAELAAANPGRSSQGPGSRRQAPGTRTSGQLAVASLLELCRNRSVTHLPDIVRLCCEGYVASGRPMQIHAVQATCWTVYMTLAGQPGVEDTVSEVLRRMGRADCN